MKKMNIQSDNLGHQYMNQLHHEALKEKRKEQKKISEEIMAKNFTNLMKN